jgi:ABC-type transport system involved in multi-copper enzyme maturation permease subunit
MTAITTDQARPGTGTRRRARAGLAGTLRSELTKIRSVRSTYWALTLLVLASLAWSIAYCAGTASHWSQTAAQSRAGFDPTQSSVIGLVLLGQLVIVVLGALTITGEYSTQAVRTSLTVMPRRGVLYGAKAAVLAAVAIAVAFPASFLSFFTGQELLASTHAGATLSQPRVLQSIMISAMFVVLCGLFSYGIGLAVRNTAGTITAVYGFLFLLPQLARALPATWNADLIRWLPGDQFDAVLTSTQARPVSLNMFSAWGELAVFGGYTVVALVAGAILLRRRDA